MKAVKKPSAIPLYGTAAVWLIWCLCLPLYRLWHFLLLAAFCSGAFLLLKKCFPPKVYYIRQPEAEPNTGNAALDETIRLGRSYLAEIQQLNNDIPDAEISDQLDRMQSTTKKIFDYLSLHEEQLTQTRRFMNYYLPTTLKLLHTYTELSSQGTAGKNVTEAKDKIKNMLDMVNQAFSRQLDSLFASQVMDITAEIRTLHTMMVSEGFADDETSAFSTKDTQ